MCDSRKSRSVWDDESCESSKTSSVRWPEPSRFSLSPLVAIEIESLPAIGEYRPSTSDRRPPALRQEAAETGCRGPVLLGLAVPGLERLALGAGHRETRYRDCLASEGLSIVLDLQGQARTTGTTACRQGDPRTDPEDESRESAVGCAADPRRTGDGV